MKLPELLSVFIDPRTGGQKEILVTFNTAEFGSIVEIVSNLISSSVTVTDDVRVNLMSMILKSVGRNPCLSKSERIVFIFKNFAISLEVSKLISLQQPYPQDCYFIAF